MTLETLQELRARIERTLVASTEERAARPDLDLEAMAPAVRRQRARENEVSDERHASLRSGDAVLSKLMARMEDAQRRRGVSVVAIEEQARLSERPFTHAECEAWKLGADWLSGKVGGSEVPGGVIAMAAKLGVGRLQPLQVIDDELAKLEADIAPLAERLHGEMDAWDRERGVVAATVRADLPPMESRITARVINRATATG